MNITNYRLKAKDILADRYALEYERIVNELIVREVAGKVALAHIQATNGTRVIEGIKILRAAFDLGLKEAKDLYDGVRMGHLSKDDLPF